MQAVRSGGEKRVTRGSGRRGEQRSRDTAVISVFVFSLSNMCLSLVMLFLCLPQIEPAEVRVQQQTGEFCVLYMHHCFYFFCLTFYSKIWFFFNSCSFIVSLSFTLCLTAFAVALTISPPPPFILKLNDQLRFLFIDFFFILMLHAQLCTLF